MTQHRDPDDKTPRAPSPSKNGNVRDAVAYADWQRLLGDGPSFWDALLAFRAATALDPEPLDIDPKTFSRDKSPGRPVDL